MIHGRGAQLDEDLAVGGDRVVDVLVPEHLRAAVLVDPHGLHPGMILA